MVKDAIFSDCGKYRYVLTRQWNDSGKMAMCIGLNPSTANASEDDPTIARLTSCLRGLGYSGLYMCNLYAFISSKPEKLRECPDPIKDNDTYMRMAADQAHTIIFCWGSFKQAAWRAKKVKEMFTEAMCFGKTKDGHPWHPLAMMYAGQKAWEAKLINF